MRYCVFLGKIMSQFRMTVTLDKILSQWHDNVTIGNTEVIINRCYSLPMDPRWMHRFVCVYVEVQYKDSSTFYVAKSCFQKCVTWGIKCANIFSLSDSHAALKYLTEMERGKTYFLYSSLKRPIFLVTWTEI